MIRKLSTLCFTAACLMAFPLLSSAATAYVTVNSGQNVHFDVSGSTDGYITVVNLANNATVSTVQYYVEGYFSGNTYSPVTFANDGRGQSEIDGLPAGNYSIVFTSQGLADYSDGYGSDWAELELFDDTTGSGWFMECDISIY